MSNHEDLRRHRQAMASRVEKVSEQPQSIDRDAFRPSLTISRTAGARAVTIARELVAYLDRQDSRAEHGWTLYDKNLVKTIIEDHVRLVGSEEYRLRHLQTFYGLESEEAVAWMRKQDSGRLRYVKAHFGEDIENPLLYHLVINTDHHSDDFVVRFIDDSLLNWAEARASRREKAELAGRPE